MLLAQTPTRDPEGRTARPPRRRKRRYRRSLVIPAVLVAAVITALIASRGGSNDGPDRAFSREGSSLVSRQSEPLAFSAPPTTYRIEYRRESLAGGDRSTTEEVFVVRRPFTSRLDASAPGAGGSSTRWSAFGLLAQVSGGSDRAVLAVPPALAAGDLRPDVALVAALEEGLVELGERRQVAGRECQVYRAGAPFSGGDIVAYAPGGDQRAEGCFDAAGLLLEELWWLDGLPTERLIATAVELAPTIDDAQVAVEGTPSGGVEAGFGSVREIGVTSRLPAEVFFELDVPPQFVHQGRYAVVWPSSGTRRHAAGNGERIASLTDVWTDGADVVVFERGGSLYGSPVLELPRAATGVPMGEAGDGVLVVGLRGNEVRAIVGDGEFVRVVATLHPQQLARLAAEIVAVAGGNLVELDRAL